MIGVAIIGTGDIANFHIEAYLGFADRCQIRAVVDLFPQKAQDKVDKYGLNCEALADYKELLARDDIGLVSICLPPSLHGPVTEDFLLAKKHVLCEKPMAPTLQECDRMLAAAEASGTILSVVAQNRFKPDIMRTKKFLEGGALGKLLFAQASSLWWRGSNYYDLWWRGTWEKEGGGCTLIHAVHHIDLLLWLMGRVEKLNAVVSNLNHDNSEVEDVAVVTVNFESGALGSLVSSLLHHGEDQRFVLDGVKGSIELPHKIKVSRQMDNGYPEVDKTSEAALENQFLQIPISDFSDHRAQIDDILTAIETGTEPLSTGQNGRAAIEFISAVYQSAFIGTPVKFPMTAEDPFYTKEGILKRVIRFHEKTGSVTNYADKGIKVGGNL